MKTKNIELKDLEYAFRNDGWLPDGSDKVSYQDAMNVKLEDALATSDAPVMMKQVVENMVRESAEPILALTSLFTRIDWDGTRTILNFPAVGAIHVEDLAEGQEYPETDINTGGATTYSGSGKTGIAVKFTEEMVAKSQFDIMGMWLREAGKAFARHKEKKAFTYLSALGVKIFDNVSTTSILGPTTGRNMHGTGNGSLTADDFFDAYAHLLAQGYEPDTVIMHPLTWSMFMKDQTLRHFVMANGGGTFFATHSGKALSNTMWPNKGGLGVSNGRNVTSTTATADLDPQFMTSAPNFPSYWMAPFRIIVSSLVPYDKRRKLTDIYMFDSSNFGALMVEEDINTKEWEEPQRDMKKIRLREKYGFFILEEGKAIGVIKNVRITPNGFNPVVQPQIDVSGSVAPIVGLGNIDLTA